MENKDYPLKNELIKFSIIVVILSLILMAVVLYLYWPHLSTKTTVLATEPIDPFDPLRGQYVIIRYEIASIPVVDKASEGDTVYVVLKEDANGTAHYESASLSKPKADLFIKGEVESVYASTMIVNYGIENYFVERGAIVPTNGIEVKVKLSGSGRAVIDSLLQDGKPVKIIYENKTFAS